jgi:uncharacterized membrane protein YeaQ/YmgE (transglycosylase-associated protein family)
MGIIFWVLFGLIVGVIAKFLTPGRSVTGFVMTTALGIAGSLVGGLVGRLLGFYDSYQSTGGFFMSVVGAVLILTLYSAITTKRDS